MKTPWVVGIVVAVHCVAVGLVMLLQGCGTTVGPVSAPPEPEMPPSTSRPVTPAPRKLPAQPAKSWPALTTTYVVRGKGHPESFHSCSHGAGRAMSRAEARRRFTVADHAAATAGIECRKDDAVLDETPAAYKDIDAVMAAQRDLVEVVHTLRQVVCVKG